LRSGFAVGGSGFRSNSSVVRISLREAGAVRDIVVGRIGYGQIPPAVQIVVGPWRARFASANGRFQPRNGLASSRQRPKLRGEGAERGDFRL
jgi:hypothetical protein